MFWQFSSGHKYYVESGMNCIATTSYEWLSLIIVWQKQWM